MPRLKLSTLIGRMYAQQEKVNAAAREVTRAEAKRDKEKAKLQKISDTIQDRFSNEDINGFTTSAGVKAELKKITGPSVKDWKKLTAYIKRTGSFALFQRRINKGTWLEHLESRKGKPVPGITKFTKVTLTVSKQK
jgi:hypothetical protein